MQRCAGASRNVGEEQLLEQMVEMLGQYMAAPHHGELRLPPPETPQTKLTVCSREPWRLSQSSDVASSSRRTPTPKAAARAPPQEQATARTDRATLVVWFASFQLVLDFESITRDGYGK